MADENKTNEQLRQEAVAIIRAAEREIDAIFEAGEAAAAREAAEGDTDDARAYNQLKQDQVETIARNAIDRVTKLLNEADDPEGARAAAAQIAAAVKNPRPGIRFSEHLERTEADAGPVESIALGLEGALNAVMQPFLQNLEAGLEKASKPTTPATKDAPAGEIVEQPSHAYSNEVDLFGNTVNIPGGLYSLVFVVLAVVTFIEIGLAEAGIPSQIGIPLLAALSIGKAVLVVMYYMHLREDSRIFIWAFGLPLALAAVIILFLLLVNPFTYGSL